METSAPQARYPIRTVTRLTGINPVTLRAWERRYGLITPQRTAKGHRLYSDDDIHKIEQILTLTSQGIAISQVAEQLDTPQPNNELDQRWSRCRQQALQAIEHFDEPTLNTLYEECLSLFAADTVTERLLVPLLQLLGERWQSRAAGIAEEHFFAHFIRNRLGARIQHALRGARGAKLLIACLPDEQHDIGALLFALHAAQHGCRPILLGADIPLDQLAVAATNAQCDGVVLSAACPPSGDTLKRQLPALLARLSIPVFVGGEGCRPLDAELCQMGAIPAGTNINSGLNTILRQLRSQARG